MQEIWIEIMSLFPKYWLFLEIDTCQQNDNHLTKWTSASRCNNRKDPRCCTVIDATHWSRKAGWQPAIDRVGDERARRLAGRNSLAALSGLLAIEQVGRLASRVGDRLCSASSPVTGSSFGWRLVLGDRMINFRVGRSVPGGGSAVLTVWSY
jgi:hypothetical protein